MTTDTEFEKVWQNTIHGYATCAPREYAYVLFRAGRLAQREIDAELVENQGSAFDIHCAAAIREQEIP